MDILNILINYNLFLVIGGGAGGGGGGVHSCLPNQKVGGTMHFGAPNSWLQWFITKHSIFGIVCLNCLNRMKLRKLILGKIIKIVAARCNILKVKCTKFDFGWDSAPEPAGGASSSPQTL